MLLTGVRDLDMKILNELEDADLVKMCQINRVANTICVDQNFWLNRIHTKFPYLSFDILNKYNQYTDQYTGDKRWSEYYIKDLIKASKNPGRYSYIAVEHGRLDYFIISLHNWPYVNDVNLDQLLHTVSSYGHLDIVKYLVSQGADINAYNNGPVKRAYEKGHTDIVDYLVSQGAPDPRV